ncbi:natural cytotoxicity triggering receptor 2-like [Xiphophorus hellerii]|uniref:natural cytotoxicity triggering receptor 2-like n=1 Tax=Xiphophorus hellerii TaxID=8084 RepID=UPI0013B37264|nr:natural cytotoxicity triggering receptor 2-like [Xiphophorus hellerii]
MKVCPTLICLFLLTLQDGETLRNYRGKEGGSITVRCEFGYFGKKRFLCKETCEGENILIETTKDKDQRGRFSIRYENRNIFSFDFLHVSITDLKPSDSGRYRCRSDETIDGTLYDDFYLVVTEDSSEPKWTQRPFLGSTFLPTASTTRKRTTRTSTQSFSLSPSETIKLPEKPAAAPGSSSVHVY